MADEDMGLESDDDDDWDNWTSIPRVPQGDAQVYLVTAGQFVDACFRSGVNGDPVLSIIHQLGMMPAYRRVFVCLCCGLPGDTTYVTDGQRGIRCVLCRPPGGEPMTVLELLTDIQRRNSEGQQPVRPGRFKGGGPYRDTGHFINIIVPLIAECWAKPNSYPSEEAVAALLRSLYSFSTATDGNKDCGGLVPGREVRCGPCLERFRNRVTTVYGATDAADRGADERRAARRRVSSY